MSVAEKFPKYAVLAVLVAGIGVVGWQLAGPTSTSGTRVVNVPWPNGTSLAPSAKEPQLSSLAIAGKSAFKANCAACHGLNAAGSDKGPPFLHNIYNPGHHADIAFFMAAKLGVRQHHWPYGDMPAQPQVSQDQLAVIVQYVRELQIANGIGYQPHRM